jgi:DNA polymerase (family 10)
MTNQEILDIIELTTKLLELHDENEFKIRSFSIAAYHLDKTTVELNTLSIDELSALQGVGKSMASKIDEMVKTGQSSDLNALLAKTPEGVIEMFSIKGIGPKKIKLIWKELEITDLRELLLACENDKVAKLKGFGEKIQQTIKESILFNQSNSDKLRLNTAIDLGNVIKTELLKIEGIVQIAIVGQVIRVSEIIDTIQILVGYSNPILLQKNINQNEYFTQTQKESSPTVWRGKVADSKVNIEIIYVKPEQFPKQEFTYSSADAHLKAKINGKSILTLINEFDSNDLENFYPNFGLATIIPAMREGENEIEWAKKYKFSELIQTNDLKGVLHNHSTYSDGKHTLKMMGDYCQAQGFEYFGIADHSKAATYARGLSEEQVYEQLKEIDQLNFNYQNFRILKGIEADILGDGSLDYDSTILKNFDYVVASVHSNLKMNEEKAMSRVIKAIENPFTTILGHPTGRVLLSRNGYPIDHKKVIDACAANGVVIELNASPYRLDIDWRWLPYCMEKGVWVSINPDAHQMSGIHDMNYGVMIAQKGGLLKSMTFNTLNSSEMLKYLSQKKG